MKIKSVALAATMFWALGVVPGSAQEVFYNAANAYLWPELPNYLTAHGPARCTWADWCWYRIARGPDVIVAAPAVAVAPRVRVRR